MTAAAALRTVGLSRAIADRSIVRQVDLEVRDGEVLTLVGPSGCGKSTLLRLIAGLEPADAGEVWLDGREVSAVPPERRRIGFVFQESALFGHLRVEQNIAFGLRHLPRPARAARVAEMLELVRLGGLGRRYPHQLSGGEQQRVALARALAPGPRVVLLDEPFASLDEVLRDELGHQVVEILRGARTASILVTHDRHEAMTLGDRVAVMQTGQVLQVGAPEDVYRHPVDRFVAGFVEVASFLPCEGDGVMVARPHDVQIDADGPDTVVRVEFVGTGYRYLVHRSDGVQVVSDRGPVTPLRVGDPCTVRLARTGLPRVER